MAKERTRKWRISDTGGVRRFHLDDGDRTMSSNAHCPCCAYSDALMKYGGDVDLRGLHRYGICYQFLFVTVRAVRDPVAEDDEFVGNGE